MRLFRFDPGVSRHIEQFGSSFLHQFVTVASGGQTSVSIMHLAPGDRVGYHEAAIGQIFAVVAGEGFVRGDAPEDVAIRTGQAAFWAAGEAHGAHTSTGLTAVVIEGANLRPDKFMPPV